MALSAVSSGSMDTSADGGAKVGKAGKAAVAAAAAAAVPVSAMVTKVLPKSQKKRAAEQQTVEEDSASELDEELGTLDPESDFLPMQANKSRKKQQKQQKKQARRAGRVDSAVLSTATELYDFSRDFGGDDADEGAMSE